MCVWFMRSVVCAECGLSEAWPDSGEVVACDEAGTSPTDEAALQQAGDTAGARGHGGERSVCVVCCGLWV